MHTYWWIHSVYYDNYEYLRSQWIPTFGLLLLWSLALLIKYSVMVYDNYAKSRDYGEVAEEERRRLVSGEGWTTEPRSDTILRFSKATNAARNAFLMLLAATVFVSMPYYYACSQPPIGGGHDSPTNPPGYVPIPPHLPDQPASPTTQCLTCVTNGTTLGTAILSWVFFGLSLLWVVLELLMIDATTSSSMRSIVAITAFPSIIAMFSIGFYEWSKWRDVGSDDDCWKRR